VDTFNADKMGIYYRASPGYHMIFKNASASTEKKGKDRIAVLFTCNMIGTIKTKPLVSRKIKSPRCFN
jgi:hypothetical protein